jgi:hypothetical protein
MYSTLFLTEGVSQKIDIKLGVMLELIEVFVPQISQYRKLCVVRVRGLII